MKTNRQKARERLNSDAAVVFDVAEMVEEWGRYDLGNMLRAIALDFKRGGEVITAPKRRLACQPSRFAANRIRARVDQSEWHARTGPVR